MITSTQLLVEYFYYHCATKFLIRVHILKPVVTYYLGNFSVTNCAKLPNYSKINFDAFFVFKYLMPTSKMTLAMFNKKCKI
jgi:hypothetical protein